MELQQRCWNHEAREAACRCPACGRSYCRECVSEHEGRLLCAACLTAAVATTAPQSSAFGKLAPPGMIAAGILMAWLIYWAAGAGLIGLIRRIEQEPTRSLSDRPPGLSPADVRGVSGRRISPETAAEPVGARLSGAGNPACSRLSGGLLRPRTPSFLVGYALACPDVFNSIPAANLPRAKPTGRLPSHA